MNTNTNNEDVAGFVIAARRNAESAIETILPPLLQRLARLNPMSHDKLLAAAATCATSDRSQHAAHSAAIAAAESSEQLLTGTSPMTAAATLVVAACATAMAVAMKTINDTATDEAATVAQWGDASIAVKFAEVSLEAAANLAQEAERVLSLAAAVAE